MPINIDCDLEGAIKALLDLKWSTRMIVKHFKGKGVTISQSLVCNIKNNKGLKRQAKENGENHVIKAARPIRTKSLIERVKIACKKENPMTQKAAANRFRCSLGTINNIIHKDLRLEKRKKASVHRLNDRQKRQRVGAAKYLLAHELTDEKLEFCVTLDEAWLSLQDCNKKRDICYLEKGERVPDDWVVERDTRFGEKIMAVAVLTGRGVGPLFFVPKDVKVDGEFYRDYVLKPLVEIYLPEIYGNQLDKVWIHHDGASSHTSKKVKDYMEQVTRDTKIRFVESANIPKKSPDVSPLDFFGFGYLKGRLGKRRIKTLRGLKSAAKEEWALISREMVQRVYKAWQHRLKLLVQKHGNHIENVEKLHNKQVLQY